MTTVVENINILTSRLCTYRVHYRSTLLLYMTTPTRRIKRVTMKNVPFVMVLLIAGLVTASVIVLGIDNGSHSQALKQAFASGDFNAFISILRSNHVIIAPGMTRERFLQIAAAQDSCDFPMDVWRCSDG